MFQKISQRGHVHGPHPHDLLPGVTTGGWERAHILGLLHGIVVCSIESADGSYTIILKM